MASLKVVARVVPKWAIPWNCFTVRFSVSYVVPLLIWLINASDTEQLQSQFHHLEHGLPSLMSSPLMFSAEQV